MIDLTTVLAAGSLATAAGGGIAYIIKAGPENESIVTRTALEVNEDQRKALKRKDEELEHRDREIKVRDIKIESLEKRLSHMREEIEALELEVRGFRASNSTA